MTSETVQQKIMSDYANRSTFYSEFGDEIKRIIEILIDKKEYNILDITERPKSADSLQKKISSKYYESLDEIYDLAAARVTTYFESDVNIVVSILRDNFIVDEANSVDKSKLLDPQAFGYRSVHLILSFSEKLANFPGNEKYKGEKFEVQVRSALQHAWAEIEHDLGYKKFSHVPKQFRRRFAGLSGLLEMADNEFCRLRVDIEQYVLDVKQKINSPGASAEINLPSLRVFYENSRMMGRFLSETTKRIPGEGKRESATIFPGFVDFFLSAGIDTTSELDVKARDASPIIGALLDHWLKLSEDGPIIPRTWGVGYFFLVLYILRKKEEYDPALNYFRKNAILNDDASRLRSAQWLFEFKLA
jgi:ppGpp synthetase/RelA/SpoT-type nucleotidyltranferase